MNLPYIPPPRTGNPQQDEYNRRVSERLQELQLLESATIQFNHTSNGMAAEVKPPIGGGSPGGDQVWL